MTSGCVRERSVASSVGVALLALIFALSLNYTKWHVLSEPHWTESGTELALTHVDHVSDHDHDHDHDHDQAHAAGDHCTSAVPGAPAVPSLLVLTVSDTTSVAQPLEPEPLVRAVAPAEDPPLLLFCPALRDPRAPPSR